MGLRSREVVLHEDKKYYPTPEVYGPEVEVSCSTRGQNIILHQRCMGLRLR